MSGRSPRIALIHGTTAAIAPSVDALAEEFDDAEVWNILDDRLLPDADAAGGLTDSLAHRMEALIELALEEGAAGVLLTCSMYGAVAHRTSASVPVLAPDQAAFEAVRVGGYDTVLLVASFESAMHDSMSRLRDFLAEKDSPSRVIGLTVPDAFAATRAGDSDALARALVAAVQGEAGRVDAVLLGQFSLAPAAARVARDTGLPVISGPQAAARMLKATVVR
ncbi:aspartate/glutamate racemase family protein [Microbacterium sp. GXF0217]